MSSKSAYGPLQVRGPVVAAILVFFIALGCLSLIREVIIPYQAGPERRTFLLTGDEPTYLLAAFNLAHGNGLSLGLRQEQRFSSPGILNHIFSDWQGSYEYFLTISPVLGQRFSKQQWGLGQYLMHRPGVSLLMAPAAWAGERQRWWSYAMVSAFGCAIMALMVLGAGRAGVIPWLALTGGLVCLLSPPALFYTQQAFPEIPFSILLTFAVGLLFRPTPGTVFTAGLCVAAAPWFSDRALPAAIFLGLAALLAAPGRRNKIFIAVLLSVNALGLVTYYYKLLGVPYPLNTFTGLSASLGYIPKGVIQLLFSSMQGLVWFFPLVTVLPLAYYFWWRSGFRRSLCLLSALAWLASLAIVSSWPDWTAGTCPRGRYAVTLQLLTLPAFLAWARRGFTSRQALVLTLLAGWGLAYGALLAPHPKWWYSKFHPIFNYDVQSPLFNGLPHLNEINAQAIYLTIAWSLLFIGLNVYLAWGIEKQKIFFKKSLRG